MNGKDLYDRKDEKAAKIQGEGLQQVQALRKAAGLSAQIRYVQNLFQDTCTRGTDTWSSKGKLVAYDCVEGMNAY